jgi:hypothetical protein
MDIGALVFAGFFFGAVVLTVVLSMDDALVKMNWRLRIGSQLAKRQGESLKASLRKGLLEKPTYALPTMIYTLLGLGLTIMMAFAWGGDIGLGFVLIGYVATIILGDSFFRNFYERDRALVQKRLTAKAVLSHLDPSDATELMLAAARDTNPYTRLVAVETFDVLVNPDVFAELLKLQHDSFYAVSLLATSLAEKMAPLMQGLPPLSVLGFSPLLTLPQRQDYELTDAFKARTTSLSYKDARQILFSQYLHLQAYPHVYCRNCHAGVERFALKDAAWLQCKVCKDATGLVYPVRKVIGQIGGVVDWALEAGLLKINLWNAPQRDAIAAEIDVLEIIAGQGFDYNWAVSAVLGELRNPHLPDNRPYEVTLIGDPPVDLNTLRLLQKR